MLQTIATWIVYKPRCNDLCQISFPYMESFLMEVIIAYKQYGVIILQNGMEGSLLPRPILPIQIPVADGFRQMWRADMLASLQVGDSPRHL